MVGTFPLLFQRWGRGGLSKTTPPKQHLVSKYFAKIRIYSELLPLLAVFFPNCTLVTHLYSKTHAKTIMPVA